MQEIDIRTPAPSRPVTSGLRADIQALRAVAVGLVVTYHLWPQRLTGGFVGVDVFFVISGFLITLHILKEAERTSTIRLGRFWTRRALRLLPAALLVLLTTAGASLVLLPAHLWQQTFREIGAATLYIQNWVLASDSVDYMNSINFASPVQHFWSLSVEEQFYIAVPIIVVLVLLTRRWRRNLRALYVLIIVTSLCYSIYATAVSPSVAYFATTTRAWEFAAGGALALFGAVAPPRLKPLAAWGGMLVIIGSGIFFTSSTPFPSFTAAIPVAGTLLVLWAQEDRGAFGRAVALAPVRLIGDVSYSLYLWHWPLIVLTAFALGRPLDASTKLVILVVAITLAYLSTRFVETPIRVTVVRHPVPRRIAVAGVATGMVVVLAVAIGGWTHIERRVAQMADVSSVAQVALSDPCFGASFLTSVHCPDPTGLTPDVDLVQADDGNRSECWGTVCTLGTAEHPAHRIAVVGDSHSNSLIPAYAMVADELGWHVDVFGSGGCYLTSAVPERHNLELEEGCRAWNEKVQTTLTEPGRYDAVVVTHFEGFPLKNPSGADPKKVEIDGQVDAWQPLLDAGLVVVAVSDNPAFPDGTVECIARERLNAHAACQVPRSTAFSAVSSSAAAAQATQAVHIDLSDSYCTAETCSPVVGGVIVLRDANHISGSFAASLGPRLIKELSAAVG